MQIEEPEIENQNETKPEAPQRKVVDGKAYILVESTKKSKYRKAKWMPEDYDSINKWKFPEINEEDAREPFAEESSFLVLFPKYREKYIRECWTIVQRSLREKGIKAELDLLEGSMKVKTTLKTIDPYAIIKARDIIKALARSVPYQMALSLQEDEIFCDVIKIKSFVRDKQRFVKRRQRLIGPNGETLKALEILTECYILVQGSTVTIIGHYRKIKVASRVVEDVMKNVHPVYIIKELMIKKELAKDPLLKDKDWKQFLPEFKKIQSSKKRKTIAKKKKKYKEKHAPQQLMRKEDIQMETGQFFLAKKKFGQKAKKKNLNNDRKRFKLNKADLKL